MYVCCAFCKFFPVHLLAPIAKIFNRQLNFDQQFWIEIRDEMDSASNFFSHILPPRGQFRRPNVECGSKSAIIGENLWKYSWSHQELPSHSPLIPLYSLSRETRFSLRGGTIKPPPHASHIHDGGDEDGDNEDDDDDDYNINNIMITSIKLWVSIIVISQSHITQVLTTGVTEWVRERNKGRQWLDQGKIRIFFKCQSNFSFFSGDLSLWCALCIVVHRETISFKKTIQGSFSHLILKIFAKKVLYLWWKQLVFSISGLDYAFLHQIFKTGLIGFQKLMGYFGEAYVNIFNEIEISCNIIFSLQPKKNLLWMYF